jgi:hypothetical protein
MSISKELSPLAVPEGDRSPDVRLASAWLRRAYLSAYRRGCNYQFTVPANDQDLDILNREIVMAMVAYAREQRRRG